MKKPILLLLWLMAGIVSAQTGPVRCNKYLVMSVKANVDQDIKNGTVKLYLIGGIVSGLMKGDPEFEEKYGIQYHDFGCVVPGNLEYYQKYNAQAFAYLNARFGEGWQEEVNERVLEFTRWRNRKNK